MGFKIVSQMALHCKETPLMEDFNWASHPRRVPTPDDRGSSDGRQSIKEL